MTLGLVACGDSKETGMLLGTVIDTDGKAVAKAKIIVGEQIIETTGSGDFVVMLEAGEWELVVTKDDLTVKEKVKVIPGNRTEITITLKEGEQEATEIQEESQVQTNIHPDKEVNSESTTSVEISLFSPVATPIPEGHVRLHYLRKDSIYEGWGLHLWGASYDGPVVSWTDPVQIAGLYDYGVYWDIPYNQGTNDLNFIIHKGDTKDPDEDRVYPNPDENREIFCITDSGQAYTSFEEALAALGLKRLDISARPEDHLRLHYYRPDGSFDGWGLHLWGTGYAGQLVEWASPMKPTGQDTYGVFWDIPYNNEGEVNFIIHKGDVKDPDGDRQIAVPSSVKEAWTVSGEVQTFPSRLMALKAMGSKIEKAVIVGAKELVINVSTEIQDPIRIFDGKMIVPLEKLDTSKAPVYRVRVREELDFNKTYDIQIGKLTAKTVLGAEAIDSKYAFKGELGNFYSREATIFKVWAPIASNVELLLYDDGFALEPTKVIAMEYRAEGVWSIQVEGDLLNKFYQYAITNSGERKIALDPYAKSMAAFDSNGNDPIGKAAIVDLSQTNPTGWEADQYVDIKDQEDVIIYEISVRDFTISESSNVTSELKGTYLGFIEKIPYLVEMGVTHVQIMPVQNFYYGNEMDRTFEIRGSEGEANYNWGYDPHNYNTPEGWFATDPTQPHVRIQELKQMIKALHDAGIGVILDVVYNHTAKTDYFENLVPGYYYRYNVNGTYTSGSGCGNDTASEREMWRKFMLDSTKYWVEEYHIDGFRFDLMGLHDEKTMQEIAETLREINPSVELHGEGWNLGTLPESDRYIKSGGENKSTTEMEHAIAVFNDTIRDAMIQEYYASPISEGGFIQAANPNKEDLIRSGIIAGMVDYQTEVSVDIGSYNRFADDPEEVITYVNCHDGYTIWDKISGSTPTHTDEERIRVNKLVATMIFTSQGKPFIHGGEEMLRSKPDADREHGVDHNSYDSGDSVNQFDWSLKEKYAEVVEYYKGLIQLRKSHEAFRMETMEEIQKGLTFINENEEYLIAFKLEEQDGTDEWQEIVVIYNANREFKTIQVEGVTSDWKVVVDGEQAGVTLLTDTEVVIGNGFVTVPAISAVVIYK